MALLDSDKKLVEKLQINEDHELTTAAKVTFLDEQLATLKAVLWRTRVDAMLNHSLKTKTDDEKEAVKAKVREHEKEAEKFAEAISLMTRLKSEL